MEYNSIDLKNKQISFIDEEIDDFRPIHYLGSKLRMLNSIKENIDKLDPGQGRYVIYFLVQELYQNIYQSLDQ